MNVGDVMRIELNCAECGGNRFTLDRGQADDSVIICEDCGHEVGTFAMLKEMFAAEVLKRSAGVDLRSS
jgi:hypothetical protein